MFDVVERVDYDKMGYAELREIFQAGVSSGTPGESLGAVIATVAVLLKKLEIDNARSHA